MRSSSRSSAAQARSYAEVSTKSSPVSVPVSCRALRSHTCGGGSVSVSVAAAESWISHLIDRQQPLGGGRHRTSGPGVGMQHAVCVGSGSVYGAVDDETGWIHQGFRIVDRVSGGIDDHQIRRGDLLEQQTVWVDQESRRRPG